MLRVQLVEKRQEAQSGQPLARGDLEEGRHSALASDAADGGEGLLVDACGHSLHHQFILRCILARNPKAWPVRSPAQQRVGREEVALPQGLLMIGREDVRGVAAQRTDQG